MSEATSEVTAVLAVLDQDRCNALLSGFNQVAVSLSATNIEAMWAVAMLQAQVLARAEYGPEQTWAARTFGELVRVALPGAMMQVEMARRAAAGRGPDG